MFEVDVPERQADIVGEGNGLAFDGIFHQCAAVLDFKLLGPAERNFQTVGQVIRDMISPNSQNACVLNDAIGIHDVLSSASTDVNNQRAKFLLFIGQERQGGCQSTEHDVINFELQTLHRANRILQPVKISVDDMDIHLDSGTQHPNRIVDAVVAIYKKVLPNRMNNMVLVGKIDVLVILDN